MNAPVTPRLADDAVSLGLRADPSNPSSLNRTRTPTAAWWGTRDQCRRLAAIRGIDILSEEDPGKAADADLRMGNEWCGVITRPLPGTADFMILLYQPAL